MPKRRKQRPADILTTSRSQDSAIPLPKRQKSERMDFESDLTDFEEDVSEQKLQVLNLESYRVSSASHENT
ncbi:hypothetical protein CANTEDRAFT_113075 [Yamadazyma tenuis ATCC 10573]|uniref:Uncharacterized protein n=3 Tax=Candida tenuis TaxID=2315449 RepID=G3B0B1_CANTC|nr:uncharacterized protein CANTEDRAFT_113075 [Yamadazyma tenuis ATCC 10573]EGV65357.1 hypothetical protein CANTEDRAFT_113075 [Yamadazyma tenuis ATCC 10573]